MRNILSISLACFLIFASCTGDLPINESPIQSNQTGVNTSSMKTRHDQNLLKVMTLNMAHGRGSSIHQLFLTTSQIKKNLQTISHVIRRENPYIVSLQEADISSFWNGRFNHMDYIAENSGFNYTFQGNHVDGLALQYGTSILSKFPLYNNNSHTFSVSPLTFPKGFVISTIKWPDNPELEIDIISVHLDFLFESTRQHQVNELITLIEDRNRPLIIMGDLNNEWQEDGNALDYLINSLALKAYKPEYQKLVTYPRLNKRYDWILVSRELDFVSYAVIPDKISDHRAVIAELTLVK
jgi:endonuclease/exonuclease/phosphatase family metal-dependent hydrolase